ncbi:low affinity iron permease family protein [Phenylobacterium sp. NIBR 498073]|uniref:low affinity iron permease family protein n=1 Tax=Phenylobacterium sp. NIBR 498073 TaxID=3015177 RepID=UPI0022B3E2E6|nr:low affinity iron permease family protein [Phenylobacterium sp. NIBR 498073]WGU42013.1 low affinity iron permease family protein [Phenylobacterium sp. NIBR 498073]
MSGKVTHVFTQFATDVSRLTGRPLAFVVCCVLVVLWAISGPLFGFSDTWQLVINTSTTIVTFLMVFLIQNTQNRDNSALHAKLDELIRVSKAHNSFIGIENLPDKDLEEILSELDEASTRARQEAGAPSHRRQPKTKAAPRRPARKRT